MLAVYKNGPVAGLNAIVEVPFGKGKAVFLGTVPGYKELKAWIKKCSGGDICRAAAASEGILITERVNKDGTSVALVIIDHGGKGGKLETKKAMTNILTGKKVKKLLKLAPYEVLFLKY